MLVGFLLKGIIVGVIIAVPVGPVGVLCIRRTILSGKLAGFLSGMGAATADAVFGIIAGFGLTVISDWLLDYQNWLRVVGAGFLLYLGSSAFLKEAEIGRASGRDADLLRYYVSTFLLTITNPVTILAFLAVFTAAGFSGRHATLAGAAVLVFGVWIGSLLWWLALTAGAGVFRKSFGRRHLQWINRGSGGILVLSGIALLGTLLCRHFG